MLHAFTSCRQGTSAVILSLALIPVMSTLAIAVNYSDLQTRRAAYQAIADGAALAGATASTTEDDAARKARASAWFTAEAGAQGLSASNIAVEVENGEVKVTATATVKPLVSALNFGDLQISVASTAIVAKDVIRRVLDVAMCIDATGSMQNTINSVKARASSFSTDLNNALAARGLDKFDYTRIRVVFYRDFQYDTNSWQYYYGYGWYYNPMPMVTSDFYTMPSQQTALQTFIGSQNAAGGGDLPESGYECIHEGMSSKWFKLGDAIPGTTYKAQEIYPTIILWSDADAKTIPNAASISAALYPAAMPRTETAFRNKWNDAGIIDQAHRLLVHFGLCANASWTFGRSLPGYMCGGTLNDGNTNMINKIADVMAVRYKNTLTRLTK